MKICRECNVELTEVNCSPSYFKNQNWICKGCVSEYNNSQKYDSEFSEGNSCSDCKCNLTIDNWYISHIKRNMKICKECKNKKYKNYISNEEKQKQKQLSRKKYNDSEEGKLYNRKWLLKKNYNITIEDYDNLFLKQNGKCAICETMEPLGSGKHFAVDHCHDTGKIRGLLCMHCNQAIGKLKHDVLLLEKAKNYLLKIDI